MGLTRIPDHMLGFQNGFNSEKFTATEGQTVFTLTNGSYEVGKKRLKVFIQGVKQASDAFTEDSSTQFTLSEGVAVGEIVEAVWYESVLPAVGGHNQNHKVGGVDELNIDELGKYNELVAAPLADIMTIGVFADNYSTIQEAIDNAVSQGKGRVYLSSKIYNETFILPSNITIMGHGSSNTIIKLPDASSADVIKTKDFDLLTGSNKWLDSEGVPNGFGIVGVQIDGNKANNIAGSGVKIYGKRYIIDDVIIRDCAEDGFYSECSYTGGQTSWRDLPESEIGVLYVKNCNRDGFVFKGAHDSYVKRLYVAESGGIGVLFDSDGSTYNGTCDIGFIHTYANSIGIQLNTAIRADFIQTEANYKEGIIDTIGNHMINKLYLYKNWREYSTSNAPLTSKHADIRGGHNVISQLKVNLDYGGVGISVIGVNNQIKGIRVNGRSKDGIGVDLDSNRCFVEGNVEALTGDSSIGLRLGNSAGTNSNHIDLDITDCKTAFNNVSWGNRNDVNLSIYCNTGQVPVTGNKPQATENFTFFSAGAVVGQTQKRIVTGTVAIDSTGTKSITVAHGLLYNPSIQDIQVTPVKDTAVNDWGYDLLKVEAVDATNITIVINVNKASATAGANIKFGVSVRV